MKTAVKAPESSDYRCGLRFFLAETPSTDRPEHFFRPLFPRTPLFPALRSDPRAVSEASRRKQTPSSAFENRRGMQSFLSHIAWESEVWIAEDPEHMIHFNGERFLGPYPDVMP